MQYNVVCATDLTVNAAIKKLSQLVNSYLIKGWKLQGGISISYNTHHSPTYTTVTVSQAIVKR